jgi:hypothetical protein
MKDYHLGYVVGAILATYGLTNLMIFLIGILLYN